MQGDKGGGAAGAQECSFILDQVQRGSLVLFYLGTAASLGELQKEHEMILRFLIFCGAVKCCSLELPLHPRHHCQVISEGPWLEQSQGLC